MGGGGGVVAPVVSLILIYLSSSGKETWYSGAALVMKLFHYGGKLSLYSVINYRLAQLTPSAPTLFSVMRMDLNTKKATKQHVFNSDSNTLSDGGRIENQSLNQKETFFLFGNSIVLNARLQGVP